MERVGGGEGGGGVSEGRLDVGESSFVKEGDVGVMGEWVGGGGVGEGGEGSVNDQKRIFVELCKWRVVLHNNVNGRVED